MDSSFGFLTMAFGPTKYIRQAEVLAMSMKRNMPGVPVALITDRPLTSSLFDKIVLMPQYPIAGAVLKLWMYQYSPFDETLFVDADCIVTRPFSDELHEIRRYPFTPVVANYLGPENRDIFVKDLGAALRSVGGRKFPKFNGGVYFFRRGGEAKQIFSAAQSVMERAEELGLINFDQAGPGEETVIGLALAQLGMTDLYDDGGRLMRTPLNSAGRIKINPLGGGCSFMKEGKLVEPAICHFCGDWQHSPTYGIASLTVREGRLPSTSEKLRIWREFLISQSWRRIWRKGRRLFAKMD